MPQSFCVKQGGHASLGTQDKYFWRIVKAASKLEFDAATQALDFYILLAAAYLKQIPVLNYTLFGAESVGARLFGRWTSQFAETDNAGTAKDRHALRFLPPLACVHEMLARTYLPKALHQTRYCHDTYLQG